MTAEEYLKSKNIWLETMVADMKAPENYYILKKMLEQYHQSRVDEIVTEKLLHKVEFMSFEKAVQHIKNQLTNKQ